MRDFYNLLMAGNDDDWDAEWGPTTKRHFPLSRYLEYTGVEVEQRLKPIGSAVVSSPLSVSHPCGGALSR